MRIWVDAQISPRLASWIHEQFGIEADAVRDLGFRDASDIEIFQAPRRADAVVLTKDADFPHLLLQHGPPPRVIWLTCGNTSNVHLRALLSDALPQAITFLRAGEEVVEITGTATGPRGW